MFLQKEKNGEEKMRPKPYMLISSQNVTGILNTEIKLQKFVRAK